MPGKLERTIDVTIDPATALFRVSDSAEHDLTVDMAGKLGLPAGRGFAARDLLLAALVSCSGPSFVKALHDLDQHVTSLRASVRGTIQEAPPQVFRSIDVQFFADGANLNGERVRQALLACRGDCSIAATLQHVAEITFNVEIVSQPAEFQGVA